MAMIDAGIFVIMVAFAFGSLALANIIRNGFIFKLLGAFVFFALSIMMTAEYDVAYTSTNSGGSLTTPQTNLIYIVGDGDPNTDNNHQWLGWLFMGLGLTWCAFFFMDLMSARKMF